MGDEKIMYRNNGGWRSLDGLGFRPRFRGSNHEFSSSSHGLGSFGQGLSSFGHGLSGFERGFCFGGLRHWLWLMDNEYKED